MFCRMVCLSIMKLFLSVPQSWQNISVTAWIPKNNLCLNWSPQKISNPSPTSEQPLILLSQPRKIIDNTPHYVRTNCITPSVPKNDCYQPLVQKIYLKHHPLPKIDLRHRPNTENWFTSNPGTANRFTSPSQYKIDSNHPPNAKK